MDTTRRVAAPPLLSPRSGPAWVAGLLAVALVLALATPTGAGVAVIETSAPLTDHSDESIKDAVWKAVERAIRGAMAMGLPQVELRGAQVFEDIVTVEIVATDSETEAPGSKPPASKTAPSVEPDPGDRM